MRTRLMAAAATAILLGAAPAMAQQEGMSGSAGAGNDNASAHMKAGDAGDSRGDAGMQDRAGAKDRTNAGGLQNTDQTSGKPNDRMINGNAQPGLETQDRERDRMNNRGDNNTNIRDTTNTRIRSHTTNITEVQRTKIKEVFRGRPGPRLTRVSFRIGVGAFVPRTVRIVPVPAEIIAIYPGWEGYSYFETADEIVIVDPMSFAIVATLPL